MGSGDWAPKSEAIPSENRSVSTMITIETTTAEMKAMVYVLFASFMSPCPIKWA